MLSNEPLWTDLLIKGSGGSRAPIVANALIALRECPLWREVLAYDESALRVVAKVRPPWGSAVTERRCAPFPWTDQDDTRTAEWLQHQGIMASPITAGQAVHTVACEHSFHPIRDYLVSLKWDGVARLPGWLSHFLGAEDGAYPKAIGVRWLVGGAARILSPGCKNDCCLVLEGSQGTLKSTALQTLGGQWYTDDMPPIGSKDAQLQMRGVWIIELSELDAISRSELATTQRQFMSRSTDRFRLPYGHRAIDAPREVVFAGTTNHFGYLHDETGARRFWPVRCGKIDIEGLKAVKDQLWAEAVVRYRRGEQWWLTGELVSLATAEQADRYEGDVWEGIISQWIGGRPSVSLEEVFVGVLDIVKGMWTPQQKKRVAGVLLSLGWERFRTGPREARQWRYRPCPTSPSPGTLPGTPESYEP